MTNNMSCWRSSTAVQRRHIAFGIVIIIFCLALFISEAKIPTFAFAGYWVASSCLLPASLALALGVKPNRTLLKITCFADIFSSCISVCGAILSLAYFNIQVYAVGWLSVIVTTFLLYHAFTVFGELDICCRMSMFQIPEEIVANTPHHQAHEQAPAPPIDFRMPQDLPKPPNYDQLSVLGEPPIYDEASITMPPIPSIPENPPFSVSSPSGQTPETQQRF